MLVMSIFEKNGKGHLIFLLPPPPENFLLPACHRLLSNCLLHCSDFTVTKCLPFCLSHLMFEPEWYYKAQEKRSLYGSAICTDQGLSTDLFSHKFQVGGHENNNKAMCYWDLSLNWEARLHTRQKIIHFLSSRKGNIYIYISPSVSEHRLFGLSYFSIFWKVLNSGQKNILMEMDAAFQEERCRRLHHA